MIFRIFIIFILILSFTQLVAQNQKPVKLKVELSSENITVGDNVCLKYTIYMVEKCKLFLGTNKDGTIDRHTFKLKGHASYDIKSGLILADNTFVSKEGYATLTDSVHFTQMLKITDIPLKISGCLQCNIIKDGELTVYHEPFNIKHK